MTGFVSKKRMAESRFAVITEDPDYDLDDEFEDSAGWHDIDEEASKEVFARIVEELSPFGTVNS